MFPEYELCIYEMLEQLQVYTSQYLKSPKTLKIKKITKFLPITMSKFTKPNLFLKNDLLFEQV